MVDTWKERNSYWYLKTCLGFCTIWEYRIFKFLVSSKTKYQAVFQEEGDGAIYVHGVTSIINSQDAY